MSAPSPLRVAVIGTGAFAEACHIPGIQSHPRAVVAAVCGRRLEAARALAAKFGIARASDDFREVCADPAIDAVTIASANVDHAVQALEALRHGKHVFCEKPLAVDAEQARQLAAAARRSGRVHQVAFTFRYNHGLRELRRRVAAGDIGVPFLARIQYDRWDALADAWRATWRDRRQVAGAGLLFDLGSHLFDITRHVLGGIESVIGYTHVVPREVPDRDSGQLVRVETDDLVNAWMRLESGLRAQFFISRVTPPFAELGYLEVVGDQGALKAALSRGGVDFLKASSPASPDWAALALPEDAASGKPLALERMMHAFVEACCRGGVDPSVDATFEDGLQAQLAMSALVESEANARWTRLDELA